MQLIKNFYIIRSVFMRRKLKDKNIRKILKNGDSYAVTIPVKLNVRIPNILLDRIFYICYS